MIDTTPIGQLRNEIRCLAHPLIPDPDTLREFLDGVRQKTYAKGAHLSREGDRVETVWFIHRGLVRYYYLGDGREHTGQFFTDGDLVAEVYAFTTGGTAFQNFETLEASLLLGIPKHILNAAYQRDHAFERFGRRVFEGAMAGSQKRSASLLMQTPDERYANFIHHRSNIAQRLPQYLIASYLGITPESLSRIRNRRT